MDIKRIRRNAGQSQEEFGGELGVSRKTISAYETDTTEVPEPVQRLINIIYKDYLRGKKYGAKKEPEKS